MTNKGFCGGFNHQYGRMAGKCGICGDPADAWPRQHEVSQSSLLRLSPSSHIFLYRLLVVDLPTD